MMDFFQQYFIDPVVTQGVAGYNLYNTPVYALLFALAVVGSYKLLKKLEIKIDRRFVIGVLPFILSGGIWRVVRDSNIIPSPLLVTPLIYISLFVATVASLLVSVAIERLAKQATGSLYYKIWCLLGLALMVYGLAILAPLGIQNWTALGIISGLTALCGVIIFVVYKFRTKIKADAILTKWNSLLIFAHMFDAATTFTALQFFSSNGYYEQHVVSSAVIGALGPIGQFALKLVVLIPVLWLLDKELPTSLSVWKRWKKGKEPSASELESNGQLRGFIKIAILILGLALGTRNMLRLILGV